jgi:hypothetical protein
MLAITAIARTGTGVVRLRPAERQEPAVPKVEPAAPCVFVRTDRRSDFLAHLIATRDGVEQTRRHRRAEPAAATSAYRRTAELNTFRPAAAGVIA